MQSLADSINSLLPQTQCTKCGYQGCKPYANAIASGQAPINRCPPGGEAGIARLAALLDRPALALDPDCGAHRPLEVANIDESHCIGCTLCIQACPVDAIVGASRLMHSILPQDCTGCELCIPPCPVDCIVMKPVTPARQWTTADADAARLRFEARERRLAALPASLKTPEPGLPREHEPSGTSPASTDKQATILAALERARARRAGR